MKIRYITPFSTKKNIGKAYNEAIEELPDDCYIVLRDGDTMFLTPDWGNQIERIIADNPEYSGITCMTNRLGLKECLIEGRMDNFNNMTDQIFIAKEQWRMHSTTVKPGTVAPGMLMIFHKSVWAKAGGFKENSILFDREFSAAVIKSGGRIGIAMGLYIFHLYRYGQKNPQNYTKHLM